MTRHGAGCYTSQAAMKRWNRRNELLADAVERASVIAHVVGGVPYPREALRETWTGFLWHQFHDDLTGTSIPEAYEFSWNDEILCQNRFAGLLEHAVATTALALDTQVRGSPIVVFNPLSMPREDIVEATVCFPGGRPPFVRVFDPRNREVPAQSAPSKGDSVRVVFLAMAPPVGYAVYDLRPSKTMCPLKTGLRAAQRTLESQRYVVTLDSDGDVSSVLDKANRRRLLTRPIAYQLLHDKPRQWPAWEIQYEDIIATPQGYVGGPAVMRVIENGPARVAIEVTRRTPRSRFRTIISLTAGGNRVEFDNQVDWYESETLLKAAFPLTAANQAVTYDLGLGVIQRGVNTPQKYEVPAHQWADLTSPAGDFGVAVLNDCKYGWDHPDSGTLRLSLIHTPGVHESWQWVGDQRSQDQGRHTFRFSLLGHRGDWREGKVIDQAARLNQPLLAFRTPQHKGELGREYSLLSLHPDKPAARPRSEVADVPAIVTAVKMAEDSREIVIRVREVNGHPLQNLWVRFARPVVSAREVNGAEEPLGPARVIDGALVISLGAFQPRAFAVSLREDTRRGPTGVTCANLALPFNEDGISTDADRRDGDFDGFGNTLSGDLLPDTLVWKGVSFAFGPKRTGSLNVVGCTGEEIRLPPSSPSRLCLLATAVGGPAKGTFKIGEAETTVWLQDYSEHLGQWNNRLVNGVLVEEPHRIAPAYVNQLPVGYVGSHRHNGRGENDAYRFTYCYALDFRVPPGVLKVTLPDDRRIKVLAATLVSGPWNEVSPAQPLVDTASATVTAIHPERTAFLGQTAARITCPNPGAEIRYTVDGSEPTPHSTRYQGPITVTETCVLKTRAFLPGADDDFVGSLQFSRLVPKEPLQAVAVEPGLRCRYYEREWSKLPNFDLFAAKQRLLTKTIAIPPVARPENYGLVFEGLVSVAQEGIYDFWISSDDGSILVVADSLLVNNDGLHGPGEVGGSMALKPGLHRIKVCMFQAQGGQDLRVFIAGPGVQKQLLPESMLWHARGPG
jgi:alpha-mannosidase